MICANEARKKAKKAYAKIVKTLHKKIIIESEKHILYAIKDGQESKKLIFDRDSLYDEEIFIEKLKKHFEKKGYRVSVEFGCYNLNVQVSWEEEE